jgi:hypothetical protein
MKISYIPVLILFLLAINASAQNDASKRERSGVSIKSDSVSSTAKPQRLVMEKKEIDPAQEKMPKDAVPVKERTDIKPESTTPHRQE